MYITVYESRYKSLSGYKAYEMTQCDRQILHSELCYAYGGVTRYEGKLLFECVRDDRHGRFVLTVQSKSPAKREIPYFKKIASINLDRVMESLKNNDRFGFEITTAPYVHKRGKGRHYISSYNGRMEWLRRTGEKKGFYVISAKELKDGDIYFKNKDTRGNANKGAYTRYRYKGTLIVTDEDLFREAIINGIGVGKSWGLGLLKLKIA